MLKILMSSLFIPFVAQAQIKVAVIDTGFDFSSTWADATEHGLVKPKLCASGHKAFNGDIKKDNHGHGTHIAGLIAQNTQNADYCLLIIKFFDTVDNNQKALAYTIAAIYYAIEQEVDIINYSGGGTSYNQEEREAIEAAQAKGIIVVAAAGNEATELHKEAIGFRPDLMLLSNKTTCSYFPACYNALIRVVGNVTSRGKVSPKSNFGSAVEAFEEGERVLSLGANNSYVFKTGTSQATAIYTGKLITSLKQKLNK